MSTPFVRGAGYALSSIAWLLRPGLRRFVAIPLLINTMLFGVGVWWAYRQLAQLNAEFERFIQDSALLSWVYSVLGWLVWPLFVLIAGTVIFYSFSVVANLIGAPFNGLLAERVSKSLSHPNTLNAPSALNWQELLLSPLVEIKKLLYFIFMGLLVLLLLFLLSFIPLVNIAAPLIWMVFSAWMLALEYADYPLGNAGLSFREQRRLLRQHWALTLGFGAVVLALTLIPVLNFLAMPVAVIGATRMWLQETTRPVHR